jgi:hypothetical protein
VWHNRNTVNGLPTQVMGAVGYLAFALIFVAIAIGHWITGIVGVVFFVVAFVALLVAGRRLYRRGLGGGPA